MVDASATPVPTPPTGHDSWRSIGNLSIADITGLVGGAAAVRSADPHEQAEVMTTATGAAGARRHPNLVCGGCGAESKERWKL